MPALVTPTMHLLTESDPFYAAAKQCAEAMSHAAFVALSGGAHSQSSYSAASVAPRVASFLAEVEGRRSG